MITLRNRILGLFIFAGTIALGVSLTGVVLAGQTSNAPAPAVAPQSSKVAAGEAEAKKLLLLMDTDKNGKVSRAEFMSFMAAEFDRLDVNHDGELDVKELEQSQLQTTHRGGTHR
ncbi:MAG: hypothetical protein ACLPH3_21875 [Terracidiphilus sp.]